MSYESEMLEELSMPKRDRVEDALLKTLFRHNGVVKEFASGQAIVDEIADEFYLNDRQRAAVLARIYRKENRRVESSLWHRLLFRAADSLAKQEFVSRPTSTFQLTNKREWMLTERGYDETLKRLGVPEIQKESLLVKSFEVEKIVKKISQSTRPEIYNPFDSNKKVVTVIRETTLRTRGFRQAVIEAYGFKCAFCGLKLNSPDNLLWEVEAAHIVPHGFKGKDDVWNGLSLCRLHHWTFDVGWLTVDSEMQIKVSSKVDSMPDQYGKLGGVDLIRMFANNRLRITLPDNPNMFPHETALTWHRENLFIF